MAEFWARMYRGRVNHLWYQPDPMDATYVTVCGKYGVLTRETWKDGKQTCPACKKLHEKKASTG